MSPFSQHFLLFFIVPYSCLYHLINANSLPVVVNGYSNHQRNSHPHPHVHELHNQMLAFNERHFQLPDNYDQKPVPVWTQDHISMSLPEKVVDIEQPENDEEEVEEDMEEYDDTENEHHRESTPPSTSDLNMPSLITQTNQSFIGNGKDVGYKHQSASNKEPFLIVTHKLGNMTGIAGLKARLRCSFKGHPLARVRWLKNEAPIEAHKRRGKWSIRMIKSTNNGKITSRLMINHLDIHDKGYYKCVANNGHQQVETTGILYVLPVSAVSSDNNQANNIISQLLDPSSSSLPDVHPYLHSASSEIISPDPSSSSPFLGSLQPPPIMPASSSSSPGSCHTYKGKICSQFIGNRSIYLEATANQIHLERDLSTIAELIATSHQISHQCHRYAIASICLYTFPLCSGAALVFAGGHQTLDPYEDQELILKTPTVHKVCRDECEILANSICRKEYTMARNLAIINHLLLPDCQKLAILGSPEDHDCIQLGIASSARPLKGDQVCFSGNGHNYRGLIDRTLSGRKCLPWSLSYDTLHYLELIGGHNYCRNPGSTESQPWCVIDINTHQKELCDIPRCEDFQSFPRVMVPIVIGISFILFLVIGCASKWLLRPKKKSLSSETGINVAASPLAYHTQTVQNYNQANSISPILCAKNSQPSFNSPPRGTTPASSSATGLWIERDQDMHSSVYHQQRNLSQLHTFKSTLVHYSRHSIKLTGKLSEGDFGDILTGELLIPQGVVVPVAIRTLRDDDSPNAMENFKNEAQTLSQLQHPNIVCLLGVCFSETPLLMMFEMAGDSDLLKYLTMYSHFSNALNRSREHVNISSRNELVSSMDLRGSETIAMSLDVHDLLHIAIQIAAGMEYLSSKHYTHRDLACRNCIVSDYLSVKISNFRLNHEDYSIDYYCIPNNSSIPVRWLPPESVFYERFTSASDVWSFGVVLWEIFSFGQQPYADHSNEKVIEIIRNHQLLQCPENCPPACYSIMLECWKREPSKRPNFNELHAKLKALQAVENVRCNKPSFARINPLCSTPSSPHHHTHQHSHHRGNNGSQHLANSASGPISSPRKTKRANLVLTQDSSANIESVYSKLNSFPFNSSASSSLGFV